MTEALSFTLALVLSQGPTEVTFLKTVEECLRKRQEETKTLYCEASVDSLFTKGSLTHDKKIADKNPATVADDPPEDVNKFNETQIWKYDFQNQSLQKVVGLTQKKSDLTTRTDSLFKDFIVSSIVDGRERSFRFKDKSEWYDKNENRPRVEMFDYAIYHFKYEDTPLLWSAGRAKMDARSENINNLNLTKDFTIAGSEVVSGNDCMVITLKGAEKSPNKMGFCVDKKHPFVLRRIFMEEKTSKKLFWDVNAEYESDRSALTPSRIIARQFFSTDGSLQTKREYRIVDYFPNKQFIAKDFDDTPAPGIIAQKRGVKGLFEANDKGELQPHIPNEKNNRRWIAWLIFSVTLSGICFHKLYQKFKKTNNPSQKEKRL